MKKIHCYSEFTSERNLHLIENFRKVIASQSKIAMQKAFSLAADAPAPRFWVSEPRAAYVIGRMLAGCDPTSRMTPEKREMYTEIYARFLRLREHCPQASIYELVLEVVNQPAPRTYMSWQRARSVINEQKRMIREERRRRSARRVESVERGER